VCDKLVSLLDCTVGVQHDVVSSGEPCFGRNARKVRLVRPTR
jgi:hypothetical protein